MKTMRKKYHPYLNKLNVGSVTLANLLTRLGSRDSLVNLSLGIERKCPNGKLLKKWLNLIKVYKKLIILTNKHPYYLKKYWHLNSRNRTILFRRFLKSIFECGVFRLSDQIIRRKLRRAYYQSLYLPKERLINFTRQLKKIFIREKSFKNIKRNHTIYNNNLLRKMNKLKEMRSKCIKYKKLCLFYSYRCGYFKGICSKFAKKRSQILPKVKKSFSDYFSLVLSMLLNYMFSDNFKKHVLQVRFNKKATYHNTRYL